MRRAVAPGVSTAELDAIAGRVFDRAGGSGVRMDMDGWTVRTADGSVSAHAEHTIVVRDGSPLVLTA